MLSLSLRNLIFKTVEERLKPGFFDELWIGSGRFCVFTYLSQKLLSQTSSIS